MQTVVSRKLLRPKNVSFACEVEKPEGASSASAPLHLHQPHRRTHLPRALGCSCSKIMKGGELKAEVEKKKINK